MDGPTFIVFYFLIYKGATFRKFKDTSLFFAFMQQKLGKSAFRHDSRGKYFDTVECIDPRLKKQITRSNSTADRLIAKCHKVFRKLILKEFWTVQLALYEAMRRTNFVTKYYKLFTKSEKETMSFQNFLMHMNS